MAPTDSPTGLRIDSFQAGATATTPADGRFLRPGMRIAPFIGFPEHDDGSSPSVDCAGPNDAPIQVHEPTYGNHISSTYGGVNRGVEKHGRRP